MLSSTTYSVPASSLYFPQSAVHVPALYIYSEPVSMPKVPLLTSFDWFPVVKETFAVKITLVEISLRD